MRKLLRDLFTGVDKETYDLGRVLWAMGVLVLILVGAGQVVLGALKLRKDIPWMPLWSPADWVTWATALGGVLVGGAGSLYMKRATEPSTVTTTATSTGPATPGEPAAAVVEQSNG